MTGQVGQQRTRNGTLRDAAADPSAARPGYGIRKQAGSDSRLCEPSGYFVASATNELSMIDGTIAPVAAEILLFFT